MMRLWENQVVSNLGADQIDVWYCFLDQPGSDPHGWLSKLQRHEVNKYRKIRSCRVARQYLAARMLTRSTLSCYADVPVQAWQFTANEHGRPAIDWPRKYRDIYFSISHTTGLVVIAVSRNPEIGIDVETTDREVEIEDNSQVGPHRSGSI